MSVSSSAVSSLCHIIRQFWWNSPTLHCIALPDEHQAMSVGSSLSLVSFPNLFFSSQLGTCLVSVASLSRPLGIISRSSKPQYFTQLEDELQRLQLLPLDLGVLPNKPRSSASLKTTTDWQLDEVQSSVDTNPHFWRNLPA